MSATPDILETPIMELTSREQTAFWTYRNAVEGVQIFGGIGSGKTSGSGRYLALQYLQHKFGGLVLTVKPDEVDLWKEYCRLSNRSDDLIIIEPNGKHTFNFLDYECRSKNAGGLTDNLMQVLKTVIRASEEKATGKSDDPFWESALDMLIHNVIDLCKLAYGTPSVEMMYNIVQCLPKDIAAAKQITEDLDDLFITRKTDPKPLDAYETALDLAYTNIQNQQFEWEGKQGIERVEELRQHNLLHQQLLLDLPDARLFFFTAEFFNSTYANLSEKTRSIIDFTFSGFLFRLLRSSAFSVFCDRPSTVTPDDCLKGKIIVINFPVKEYHKVGRDCQIMFKYIWQRAMEKRRVKANSRIVFLWADEAQNFLHQHDVDYQATARSSRIATVYISQNLPNYISSMSGDKAQTRVQSFLGTLGTKIFHANADIETNNYASELIGDGVKLSTTETLSGMGEAVITKEKVVERRIRPEKFVRLRSGGQINQNKVDAYVHVQGPLLAKERGFVKQSFDQNIL